MVALVTDFRQRARELAAAVPDPEIPSLTIGDLGILRDVRTERCASGERVVVVLTPTYSGCPAVETIENAVASVLAEAGIPARIERSLSPAWSSDWITAEGRARLQACGIAPPACRAADATPDSTLTVAFFADDAPACPRCGSRHTGQISAFGSTACKAQYRCLSCREPFDYFKPI